MTKKCKEYTRKRGKVLVKAYKIEIKKKKSTKQKKTSCQCGR